MNDIVRPVKRDAPDSPRQLVPSASDAGGPKPMLPTDDLPRFYWRYLGRL